MSHFDYKPFYRRNLPHIQPPGATFFVTFHLAGSLPRTVLQQWATEKDQLETEKLRLAKLRSNIRFASAEHITLEKEREHREWEWQRRWFRKFETTLDKAQSGPVWLKDERIAKEVAESLRYRDGKVYRLAKPLKPKRRAGSRNFRCTGQHPASGPTLSDSRNLSEGLRDGISACSRQTQGIPLFTSGKSASFGRSARDFLTGHSPLK
jgi:hypothetical protein